MQQIISQLPQNNTPGKEELGCDVQRHLKQRLIDIMEKVLELRILSAGSLAFWKVTELVGEYLSWFQPRTVPFSAVAMVGQSLEKCGHVQDPGIV